MRKIARAALDSRTYVSYCVITMIAYRIQPSDRATLPTESTTWTDGEDTRAGASCCHSVEAVIAYYQRAPDGSLRSRTTREHLADVDVLTVEGTWSDVLDHDHDRHSPFGASSPILVVDGSIVARRTLTAEEIAEILIGDIVSPWQACEYAETRAECAAARATIAASWGVSVATLTELVRVYA